jgi:hypothetical protein
MSLYTHHRNVLLAVSVALLLSAPALAQSQKLVDEDWYGEVKKILSDHYTGKTVRLKLPIPNTRRGLEMVDGAAQREASKVPLQYSATIGEELTIKSFRVYDSNVEVLLEKDEPPRKSRFSNPFTGPKQPRINLRFSHELSSKDLTIENLNHFLSLAMDVTPLAAPIAERNPNAGAPPNQQPEPPTIRNPEIAPADTSSPTANVVADSPIIGPNVGELTVECNVRGARIYIDGSYSGVAPRTLRLRTGLHTILIVSDGYENWERKLLIPGGKISVTRAEMKK